MTVETVIGNLSANIANAQRILQSIAQKMPADRSEQDCGCSSALATSIMTATALIPQSVKEKYQLLISKYVS